MKKLLFAIAFIPALSFAGAFTGGSSGSGGGTGSGIQASDNTTFTGINTFNSSTTFNGTIAISSGLVLGGSAGTSGQVLTSSGSGHVPVWTTASGGGNYTYTKISDTTLVGASTFSYVSIPATYDEIMIKMQLRSDNDANNDVLLKLNGSAGPSAITYGGAVPSGATFTDGTVGYITYPSAAANSFMDVTLNVPFYTSSHLKNAFTRWGGENATTDSQGIGVFTLNSTAVITSISLSPSSTAQFVAGSRFIVYGITY